MAENVERIVYRQAAVGEIRDLRGAVLRPVTRVLVLPGDDAAPPATWHFGAFLEGSARCVGCATYLASQYEERPAMQLRGMAVDEHFRGLGVGGNILDFAEPIVTAGGVRVLWCNAREIAIPFYENLGWRCVSDFFEEHGVGPHKRMLKVVG